MHWLTEAQPTLWKSKAVRMPELSSSGQIARRASEANSKARRLEEMAKITEDHSEKLELLEAAVLLKSEALELEKSARWFAYLDRLDLRGKNRGRQNKTNERREFLSGVADEIGTKNREAVAAQAIEAHASRVRALWHSQGQSAVSKILNFMRNHRVP